MNENIASTNFKYGIAELARMQKYTGGKATVTIAINESNSKKTLLEDNLQDTNSDAKSEKKLEEVAKSIKEVAKEEPFKILKEENGFTAYDDKNAKSFFATYNSSSEDFYEGDGKDYYDTIMRGEENSMQIYAPQAQIHEHETEKEAEKSQYLAKESMIAGAEFTTNGTPSLDDRRYLGASSVRTEKEWAFKMLHPGMWHWYWDGKAVPV